MKYGSVYSRCYATIVRWPVIRIKPVSGQRLGKHVPVARGETGCCLRGPR
jgi:hypothetical protein